MMFKEIKTWAKKHGYEIIKDKEDNQYYWAKLGDNNIDSSGVTPSVSKVARAIYNDMADNAWVSHQNSFKANYEENS